MVLFEIKLAILFFQSSLLVTIPCDKLNIMMYITVYTRMYGPVFKSLKRRNLHVKVKNN